MSFVVPSAQVDALPMGSGGNNATKRKMNDVNVNLSMLSVQSVADQKYDPPVPVPAKPAVIKEAFCSSSMNVPSILTAIGVSMIVYGLISK